jgi:hypothetical protein
MISDSVEYFAFIPCLMNKRFANTLPHIGAMGNVLLGGEIKQKRTVHVKITNKTI